MGKGCNDETCFDYVEYFWMLVGVVLLTECDGAGWCGHRACCSGLDWPQFKALQEAIVMPFFSEAQAWWGTAACLICFAAGLLLGWWYGR